MALAKGLSLWLPTLLPNPELAPLLATQPIPPAPLYLLFGMSAASTLIALCSGWDAPCPRPAGGECGCRSAGRP